MENFHQIALPGIKVAGAIQAKRVRLSAPSDPVPDDLWNQLNNPQKVSRNLLSPDMVRRFPSASGRWVIEIEVPRATRHERPIFINGNPLTGTYKRNHAGDYHCREDEVERILAEQTEDARDARLLPRYSLDDLEMDSLKGYRNRLAALKPDHPFNGAANLEFLRKLGGWRKDRHTGEEGLTLAGLLMFGKQEAIHEAIPHFFLDYRELPFAGAKTQWVDRLGPDGGWPALNPRSIHSGRFWRPASHPRSRKPTTGAVCKPRRPRPPQTEPRGCQWLVDTATDSGFP